MSKLASRFLGTSPVLGPRDGADTLHMQPYIKEDHHIPLEDTTSCGQWVELQHPDSTLGDGSVLEGS